MKIIIPKPSSRSPSGRAAVVSMISRTVPRAELYVCQSSDAAMHVVEAAQRVEVVLLVVIERRFVAEPAPHGYGSASISASYGS